MTNSVEEWLKTNKVKTIPYGVSGRVTKKQKIKAWKREKQKPQQKSMAELVQDLKAKPKQPKIEYYTGDDPPWD